MITLNCPDCDQEYKLDDDMAGKKAACQCGSILFVPKIVDAPQGQKSCPQCNKLSNEESVICVNCGYNFHTGGRMRSAETRIEHEDSPKIIFLRRIIKPCIFLIILIVVGVIIYNMFFVKHYGISSGNPLGTIAAIEEHLKKCGYVKQDLKEPYIPKVFKKGAKRVEWKDVKLEKLSKGMDSEKIFIILSTDNKVLAIGANFKGVVGSIPGDTGSATGRFMSSMWKEVELPFPPDYKSIKQGKGRWAFTYNKAEAVAGELRGMWIEHPSDVSILPSAHTMLITYSRFSDVTYESCQQKSFEGFDIESFKKEIEKETKK